MITLPSKFVNHVKGADTQLIPLVIIGTYGVDITGDISTLNNYQMHFSTQSLNVDGVYFKPLINNIPSLKESIDPRTRNFKISSVTIKLNNQEFEGSRISDVLTDGSLMNKEIRIFWYYPGATGYGFTDIDGIDQDDSHAVLVYLGRIRRLTHDEKIFTIIAEDLTEERSHAQLPNSFLGDGINIPSKFKNKPIPMVYGEVYRSPTVTSYGVNTSGESGQIIHIDSEIIGGFLDTPTDYNGNNLNPDNVRILSGVTPSPLHIYKDGIYISIVKNIEKDMQRETDPDDFTPIVNGTEQWNNTTVNEIVMNPTVFYTQKMLQGYVGFAPSNIKMYSISDGGAFNTTPVVEGLCDTTVNHISDPSQIMDNKFHTFEDLFGISTTYTTQTYISYNVSALSAIFIDFDPQFSYLHLETQTFFNNVALPFSLSVPNIGLTAGGYFFMHADPSLPTQEYAQSYGTFTTYKQSEVEAFGETFDMSGLFNLYADCVNSEIGFTTGQWSSGNRRIAFLELIHKL